MLEIAFLMPQFMPVRDGRFDYTRPVDGSNPATDWQGLHPLASLPSVANPRVGGVHDTNDWPWSAAGPDSPRAADYPRYMDQVGGNARGEHAVVQWPASSPRGGRCRRTTSAVVQWPGRSRHFPGGTISGQ